jgi:hypothetical protein
MTQRYIEASEDAYRRVVGQQEKAASRLLTAQNVQKFYSFNNSIER